jgi:hypothetical protein
MMDSPDGAADPYLSHPNTMDGLPRSHARGSRGRDENVVEGTVRMFLRQYRRALGASPGGRVPELNGRWRRKSC